MDRYLDLAALMLSVPIIMAAAPRSYFPPDYARRSFTCSAESQPHPFLSEFEQEWFARNLRAAREAPLYDPSHRPTDNRVIRFTWLGSFHPPIVVRLIEGRHGWHMVGKRLSGRGGYDPGTIGEIVDRPLRQNEAKELESLLVRSVLPDLSGDCVIGLDGAQWIIERTDQKGYHFINRWSPTDGPVHQIGLFALKLTGWRVGPVY